MPELVLKETGERIQVAPENLPRALASGLYEAPAAGMTAPVSTTAGLADVSVDQLGAYQANYGDPLASNAEVGALERESYLGRKHEGALSAVGTFVEQAANEATFGATGFLGEQIAGEDYRENMEGRAEVHDTAATAGGITGVVGTAILSGGTGAAAKVAGATGAGLATRAGASIASKGVGRGIAAETAAAMAGAGVESALLSSGHVLAETVLHDKELSAQAFVAGAAEGGLWGIPAGGAASLLSQGTRWGKSAYDKAQTKAGDLKSLVAEQKALQKAADADAKALAKAKTESERHINRVAMEELRQQGRLKLADARTGAKKEIIDAQTAAKLEALEAKAAAQKDFAGFTTEQRIKLEEYRQAGKESLAQIGGEAKLKLADKALEREVAKAEARVAVSRAKLEGASERLAIEEARTARAKLVMDGRLELADTYTGGWRRAAESREAVAASKLDAAALGADARTRVGLAEALTKSGRADAGHLIEEMIPSRLRTPKAQQAALADVTVQVERLQSTTERLIAQADEIMAVNPAAADDLMALRAAAAETGPASAAWTAKATEGADDFAGGFRTIRQAEQAQHDLAQAIRQQADGMPTPELDAITAGMDGAVTKTDDIVEGAVAKQIKAVNENAGKPGAGADGAAVADLLLQAGGLPNADDIPVIGPVLGAYLKFRAVHGALNKFGIRLPGPVGRIAAAGTTVQNKASEVISLAIQKAPAAAKVVQRASPSLSSILSKPLWEPLDDDGDDTPAGHYNRRVEELDRALSNPEETRQKIQDSIPAPPTVASAIADSMMRGFEYLKGLTQTDPRAPTIAGKPARANRVEINTLAEATLAVRNPVDAFADFVNGVAGPAVIDAVRTVYPRLYASMQEEALERMAESDDEVPFPRLLRMAMFLALPLTNATTPRYGASRQAEYATAKEAAQQPAPGGAQLRLSKLDELGSQTRAMR